MKQRLRISLGTGCVLALTLVAAIWLTGRLASARFERTLFELSFSRLDTIAGDVSRKVELGLTLGLDLAELADLQALAERTARLDEIVDTEISDERGIVLFAADRSRIGLPQANQTIMTQGPAASAAHQTAAVAVRNSFGQIVGQVAIVGSIARLKAQLHDVLIAYQTRMAWIMMAAGLLVFFGAIVIISMVPMNTRAVTADGGRKTDPVRKLVLRLTVAFAVLLACVSALSVHEAVRSFDRLFQAELLRKATTVNDGLAEQIRRALNLGIPFGKLVGVDALFAQEITRHPDLAYIALVGDDGLVSAAAGRPARVGDLGPAAHVQLYEGYVDTARAILGPNPPAASLHVGVATARLAHEATNFVLELAAVAIVSLLLTFEILLVVVRVATRQLVASQGNASLSGTAGLASLRLAVFAFCMAEEFSRPFLPAYAKSFAPTAPWLSPDLVVSLPITLFMMVWAFSQPMGARFSDRFGRAKIFAIGAALAALGFTCTAFAGSLLELMIWRAITALGYGIVLICAQGTFVDNTTSAERAAGMASYIGALLAAGVCGPVIGGILADHIGIRGTFLIGASLAAMAGIAVSLSPLVRAAVPPRSDGQSAGPKAAILRTLMSNRRFAGLMLLSAVPTKIAATSILFVIVPLLMANEGANKAEVGRVQMLYYLAFIVLSPLVARLSDRWNAHRFFIVMGGIGTLASCALAQIPGLSWALPLGVACFGLVQSLIGAPQLTLVSEIARDISAPQTAAIGWYRLIERIGGALGPILAMSMVYWSSYREALLGIGLLCAVGALLFLSISRSGSSVSPNVESVR